MSLAVAQQIGGPGSGVTWVTVGDTVIGILGPDGETVYSQFVRQPDGSVQMQIVPRTGTEAALLALAGGIGELASSTNRRSVVQFTGNENEGSVFRAAGHSKVVEIAGSGVVATSADAWLPNTAVLEYRAAVGATFTDVSNLGKLDDGYYVGQRITLINNTGVACTRIDPNQTGPSGDTTAGAIGIAALYEWDGTVWDLKRIYTPGVGSEQPVAILDGDGTSLAVGPTVPMAGDIQSAVAFGNNATVLASGGIAFPDATAGQDNSVAFKGTSRWASSWQQSFIPTGTTYKANAGQAWVGRRISASGGELTITGLSTIANTSTICSEAFVGCILLEIDVFWWQEGTNNYAEATYRVAYRSDGTTGTVLGQRVAHSEVYSGLSAMPTLTISADPTTVDRLKIHSSGLASTVMTVAAAVRFVGAMQE